MRMVCDSSYILTRYDTKVDEMRDTITDIISEEGEKVVVFSQWERMTGLRNLEQVSNICMVACHGKRKNLVDNFMKCNYRVGFPLYRRRKAQA